TAWGHPTLAHLWAIILLEERGHETVWEEWAQKMFDRLNSIVLTAGLLAAAAAVFATTPPPRPSMLNYTVRGPYALILTSLGLLGGCIIVSSAFILVIQRAKPYWVRHVLQASRCSIYCTMIMLSYPFFAITTATWFLTIG
ncbi:hypothetical protein BKA62DRAFT_597735, partial [Auriculariales sp. MPI-PUGE-AT-0066]